MKTNRRAPDHRTDESERLAGGYGAKAARQDAEQLLRRAVLANLLWEDVAYEDGESVASQIKTLVPQIEPETVAQIARQARLEQRLRHVPLMLARECARHETHRHVVDDLLADVVMRPDEMSEFLSLYWDEANGDRRRAPQPLASGVKRGLARAFTRFDAYQLGKYDRPDQIKLRDVMFMVHPSPRSQAQRDAFKQLADGDLPAPDTWEVALSTGQDKRATWERLVTDRKLGALAFMRNLRNMEQAGVNSDVVRAGFEGLNVEWLLPLNFFAAAKHAPSWIPEIEHAMFRSLGALPKLAGETILVVDVSGSMTIPISSRSTFTRLDAAAAMAILAREMCESVVIWATAGNDYQRAHSTTMLKAHRGFALAEEIGRAADRLGGGGIFTRQALEYIKDTSSRRGDRTIVFSDSQDCDSPSSRVPRLFSPRNYVVDVSSHTRGVAYDGVWTAEISGWSEQFLRYVQAYETLRAGSQ